MKLLQASRSNRPEAKERNFPIGNKKSIARGRHLQPQLRRPSIRTGEPSAKDVENHAAADNLLSGAATPPVASIQTEPSSRTPPERAGMPAAATLTKAQMTDVSSTTSVRSAVGQMADIEEWCRNLPAPRSSPCPRLICRQYLILIQPRQRRSGLSPNMSLPPEWPSMFQ